MCIKQERRQAHGTEACGASSAAQWPVSEQISSDYSLVTHLKCYQDQQEVTKNNC